MKMIKKLPLFILSALLAIAFLGQTALAAPPVKVGVVNLSPVSDASVERITEALQTQVSRDFAPVYGTNAEVKFYRQNESIPDGVWKIYLVERYNFPELGFHYVDSLGVPAARVSVERSRQYGKPESLVLSHELLEMLANPFVDRNVLVSKKDSDEIELYLFEVSDAVMSAECGYKINNILVSDFVYPWWFDRETRQKKFSHNGCAERPLEIARAGYMPHMKLYKKKRGYARWDRKF